MAKRVSSRSGKGSVTISAKRRRFLRAALEWLEPRINMTSYIWSGAVSESWSDPGNWEGGVAPTNDPTADLFFTATGDISTFNDIVNGTFNSIEIDAPNYFIQGNSLSLNAGITGTFTSGSSHLQLAAIALTAPQTFQSTSSSALGLDIQSSINTGSSALTVGGTGNTTFRVGVISGNGSLSTSGTATVHMQGAQANTYSGTTTVGSGTLLDLNSSAVAVPGDLSISGGTVTLAKNAEIASSSGVSLSGSSAKLDLQGHTQTIGTLNDAGATLDTVALGAGTLTIGGSGASTFGGSISGTGGKLTVSGSGTVTLNGTSSYTGATTVSHGTLLVNGSNSTSATSITGSGAVLGGTGTIGTLNATTGTTNPGSPASSKGILTGSSANFSSGGNLKLQVSGFATPGLDYDRLNLGSGALTLGGTSSLTLDVADLSADGTALGIATYGSVNGTFTSVNLVNNPYNLVATVVYGANSLDVVITNSTSTALASSANPSVFGQTVTFTATVSTLTPGLTPTGTVNFLDNGSVIASRTLDRSGVATFTTSSLSVAAHAITVAYLGDSIDQASTSATTDQVVNQDTTTTSLSSTTNPSVYGQSVTITATAAADSPGGGTLTGTVQFYDNGTPVGSAVTLVDGHATLYATGFSVATHPITAVYSGDGNFVTSTSSTLNQVVNKDSTTTTIVTSANPILYGSSETITATVAVVGPGVSTPTGTVQFYDNGVAVGEPVAVVSGQATLDLSTFAVGTHPITAVYSGDTHENGSSSNEIDEVIRATTTTVVSPLPNPSVYGQSVTLTATVTAESVSGAGTPTGTVVFYDNGVALTGSVALVGGVATFSTSSFIVGTHPITAVYSGDTYDQASSSSSVDQTVNKASTSTTVTSTSSNPSLFGESVTFTATVTPNSPGGGVQTGTVQFKVDGSNFGSPVTLSGGQAGLTTSALSVATHSIVAVYSGDSNDVGSTSSDYSQEVDPDHTQTAVTASHNPSPYGELVTFTATVTPIAPGSGIPTGTVQFKIDGSFVGLPVTMSGGQASYSISAPLIVGAHTVVVIYSGDTNNETSTSPNFTQTVIKDTTTTIVDASPIFTTFGQDVTFTATVAVASPGAGTPGGSVEFFDGTTSLGSAPLDLNGQASISTSALSAAIHTIKVVYSGDGNDFASDNTGSLFHYEVKPVPTTVYVNGDYLSKSYGDVVPAGAGTAIVGYDAFGTIQEGIDAVQSGGTVYVAAGTYVAAGNFVDARADVVDGILIDKPLSLLGPLDGFDPIHDPVPDPSLQAIVLPGTSNPDPSSPNAFVIIGVAASDVTIRGMTIDGSNTTPGFTHHTDGGTVDPVMFDGTFIDAYEGIASYSVVGSITIENNIVTHVSSSGIVFSNGAGTTPGTPTSGNTISQNLIENLGGGGYQTANGVVVYNNFYANVTDNKIENVNTGVFVASFDGAPAGDPSTYANVAHNTIATYSTGIYYADMSEDAALFTVEANDITAVNDPTDGGNLWAGILIVDVNDAVQTDFLNNDIDGSLATGYLVTAGYELFSDTTNYPVEIDGGDVSGVDYGVFANNYDSFSEAPHGPTYFSLEALTIHDVSSAGVYIKDNPLDTAHDPVGGEMCDCVTITAAPVGVKVSGAHAFLFDDGATIHAGSTSTGILVDGGKALIQYSNLSGNQIGILVENGATVDAGNPTGTGSGFTGLGVSQGSNNLQGYTGQGDALTGSHAIVDLNSSVQPNVMAQSNDFGPVVLVRLIGNYIYDHADDPSLSTVDYSNPADVQPAANDVYVDQAWAASALGATVGVTHTFGVDAFATIQDAIDAVASGGTVHIDNGTYVTSNLLIANPMTIVGESKSGVIITPAMTDDHDDSNLGGTPSNGFIINASNVTIQDLTIDGGAGFDYRNAIITYSPDSGSTWGTFDNITLQNLSVNNIFRKGIALYTTTGESTGDLIQNNTFDNIGAAPGVRYEGSFAIAVFQAEATITGNTITDSAGGIAANSTDGIHFPLLTVSDNNISSPSTPLLKGALGLDLASLTDGSVVSNNIIDLTDDTSDDVGIVISFDAGQVNVSGNMVTGKDGDIGILLYQDTASATPVNLQGNTVTVPNGSTSTGTGILLTDLASDANRFSDVPGAVYATLLGNTVTGFATGVSVAGGSDAVVATLGDGTPGGSNAISGATTGLWVSGASASATVNVSEISGSSTGIAFTNGGAGSVAGVDFDGTSNGADLWLTTTAGTVTVGSDNAFYATNYYVLNQSSNVLDLSGNGTTFDGSGVNDTSPLSTLFAIQDEIVAALDNSAYGLVRIVEGHLYVTQSDEWGPYGGAGAINRAVAVASANDTINFDAGTYVATGFYVNATAGIASSLLVDKPLTLLGPLADTFDPNSPPDPSEQAIIEPGASDPNISDATALTIIGVNSSGVTIKGLTIRGTNDVTPGFVHSSPAITFQGVTIDAAEGISSYVDVGSITLENNIIEYTAYSGADFQNGPAFSGAPTNGNTISNNLIRNLGGNGWGAGVILYDNFYANVTYNVITNVRVGVQTGNFYAADAGDPSADANISNNEIASYRRGVYYNLMYGDSSPFTVSGNHITAVSDPTGPSTIWSGFYIISLQEPVETLFTNNVIDATGATAFTSTSGYLLWNDTTSNGVTISGGSVTGAQYGVLATNFDALFHEADSSESIVVSGVTISGASVADIYVQDSPSDPDRNAVSVTVNGGSTLTGSPVGVLLDGGHASATLNGAAISDNTTGVKFTNGGSGSLNNVDFAGLTPNGTDLRIDTNAGAVSVGTGNAFDASVYTIDNRSSQGIDATQNTFGGIDPRTATLGQLFDIDDQIIDALDNAAYGLVRVKAGNIFVTQLSGSIQRGINAASPGDTVHVQAGPYSEHLTVNKSLTLIGQGSSTSGTVVVTNTGNAIAITADNVTLQSLRVNSTGGVNGVYFNSAVSNESLCDVVVTGASNSDLEIANSAVVTNLSLDHVSLINAQVGLRTATTGVIHGLTISNSHLDNDTFGFYTNANSGSTSNQNDVTNVYVTNTTFNNDLTKGIYVEAIDSATFDGITVSGSGTAGQSPEGIDINLKYGTYTGGLAFTNTTILNSGAGTGAAFMIDIRNDSPSYNSNPASISSITLSNVSITGGPIGLSIGDNASGVSLSGVQIHGSNIGMVDFITHSGTLNLGDTSFDGTLSYLINQTPYAIDATNGATFNGFNTGSGDPSNPGELTNYFLTEDKIADAIDAPGVGLVRLRAGHVFVTPNSYLNAGAPFTTTAPSIQRGINAASAGDTVHVQAGTYPGGVAVNKSVTVLGQGSGTSGTVVSLSSGNGIEIAADNVALQSLRITGTSSTNGVYINSNVDGDSLTDVVATGNGVGLELHDHVISNLSLDNVSLINGTTGLRASTTVQVHTLSVTNSHFDHNSIGFYTNATSSRSTNNADFTNVTISNSTFDNDAYKGIYVEKLDHATLDGIEVIDSGTVNDSVNFPSPAGIDINLKYGNYSHITIQNATVTDSGTGSATTGNGLTIKGRNDAPSYNTNPANLANVLLSNVTISGSPIDLSVGNAVSGVSMSGVSLNGGYAGQSLGLLDYNTVGPLNIGDTSFDGALNGYIINSSTFGIDATGHAKFNGFDTSDGDPTSATDLAKYFAIEDKIGDAIDQSGVGLVRLKSGHVFVTQNSFGYPFTTTSPDIQRGIDAATSGDTIHVQGGSTTYVGSHVLNINKNVSIIGSTDNFNPTIFRGTVNLAVDLSNVTFSYLQFTSNTTSYISDGAPGTLLTTGVTNRSLSNVTFSHDLFAFTGTTAPNSDFALLNFWNVAVSGANGLQFLNTTFSTGDPTGGNGPSAATMWLQGTGGPIMFDGVTNEGHYTNGAHKMGSQINIGFGTNVTLKNSLTDDGGNFYLSGMSGLQVFNNDFLQSGFALNGVQDAYVHDNTFQDVGTSIDASGGGENRAIVLKAAWGALSNDNVQIYNNKFQNLTIPAFLLNQYTTADPDSSTYQNVALYHNDFSGVSGVPAVDSAYNSVTIDAANNWWGSKYGPTTAANPGGAGAGAGDHVAFTPWIGLFTNTAGSNPGFAPTAITSYAVPTRLVFTTQPSPTARHGVPFGTQPVVTAEDAFGNLGINFDSSRVPGSQVALTLNAGSYTGTLAGAATLAATDGVVSFSGLNITQSGTYTLTANAQGSTWTSGLAIASAASDPINVVQEATTTTLTASPNPSVYGQTVTFTATVATVNSGVATPTGSVTFKEGSTVLGTASLDGSGVATFTYSTLSVGNHTITAVYSGDTSDTGSTSNSVSQVVNQDSTTTTLIGSPASPTVYGQSITFTATVAPVAPGAGLPTGTVTFKDGSTTLGTGTLDGSGVATFTIGTLSVGSHSITATYGGDTNDLSSTSSAVSRAVNKDNTQTVVTSTANPSVHGQSVTFTATVTVKSPGVNTPTGVVIFLDNGTPIGSGTLNASGVATFTTSNLSVATHPISAAYGGDTRDLASSGSLSQVVNKDSTTTSLTSSLNPSLYGQSVTFTATVAAVFPGVGIPTGTVTFKDGSTTIGTGTLNGSGVATFSISTSAIGSRSITAVYGGDANDLTSTSAVLTQVVQDTTTTAISTAPNPSVFGQSVTLTATVTAAANPGAVTPTGTVTFFDGATNLGTGTLNGSGVATLSVSALAVGTHSITASYAGDTYNQSSSSSAASQVVNQDTTSTALNSSVNPSVYGQSVTFTATVTVVSPGAGTPTGTVTFFDGATSLGTGTLNGSGVATLSTADLSVATHSVTAVYAGDTNDAGSTSSAVSQIVNKDSTTTTLVAAPNPSVYGQSVTLTATVTVDTPGVGTPTGTVTFYDGPNSLGTVSVDGSGIASLSTASLSVATHAITAIYSGDTNDVGSMSNAVSQVVNKDSTTTTLVVAPNPSIYGQSVTLTATVGASSPGSSTPSGTVTFYDGATSLGTVAVDGSGHASISTSSLSVATHSLTAVYSGDANETGSSSSAVSQVVNQDSTTTVLVAAPNPSVYGQSVTLTATVTVDPPGAGTPGGTVTFYDGATSLGSASLDGSGHASISTSGLSVGTHSLTAVYGGDTNDIGSSSSAVSQVVNKDSTTTALSAAPNPSTFGVSVTFTATVTPVAPGADVPTGAVTFYDGATPLGTRTLNGSGVATLTTSSLALGTHPITAVYAGDTNDFASTSNEVDEVVQNLTSTAIASSVNPSVFGQSVLFTATVTVVSPGTGTPTGTVAFYDGATLLGTGTLDGSGEATLSLSDLSVEDHSITAVYAGDTLDVGSTSDAITQTVGQDDTATTLISSASPSFFGQSVTFTATVTVQSPGAGTPSGTVIFLDGFDLIGTGTLNGSGEATLTLSDLAVGDHSITALYAGDTNDQASSSDPLDQLVNQDTTTTLQTSSPNPSTYGQTVTITATVSADLPGVNLPTGTITFMDGSTDLGTVALDEHGVATLTISTLAVGTHPLTAEYSGDTNDVASTSNEVDQIVQNTTTTALATSVNPSVFGQSVTFTATVTGASVPGVVTPTGTVTFFDGATSLGSRTLNGSGVATLSLSTLSTGSHSITAVYLGDTYDLNSTSNTVTQTVNKDTTTTVLTSSSHNPSVFGESVSITATVSPVGPGAGIPTGSVSFFDGATFLVTLPLSGGQATLTTASLAVGTHSITAVYAGDANDFGSTSDAYSQVVNKDDTTTVLTSSLSPSQFMLDAVTFTATISVNSPGAGVPTGSVTFYDNGVSIGTGTVSTMGGVTTATFTISTLTVGSHPITAIYSGDTNDNESTSNVVNQSVISLNHQPTATSQTLTVPSNGKTLVTLHGTDVETIESHLVFTVTSLPSSGTLLDSNGNAVTVGATFVGSADTLTYLLPTFTLGNFSTSFTYTATDDGYPAGSGYYPLTSDPATATIQTPAGATVLRISGTNNADTISLAKSGDTLSLEAVVNGSTPTDFAFSSLSQVFVYGIGGNDSFTVAAGLTVPITINSGNGNTTLTAGATNLTFQGGTGTNSATLSTSGTNNTVSLSPVSSTLTGTGYSMSLTNVANFTVSGGSSDTVTLNDVSGSNSFSAAPGSATFSGTSFSQHVTGFGKVYGVAASGTSDSASLSDASGSNTLYASPNSAAFSGTGFYEKVTGFKSITATAASGTNDVANLSDSSGSNTFTATQTSATFTGTGFTNAANGFKQVYATAAAGTTDTANFSDSSGSNMFTARPTVSTFSGTGFLNQASGFATVTATAANGTTDTANLYDASGSNTFTASPTSATFMGTGLSETATGFKSVLGFAANGTNDSANLSDASGSNTLYESPNSASFSGTGFSEKASGFKSITVTAANGTNDVAYLSDTSGTNTFTATQSSATFTGTGFTNRANGFKQVYATAAAGTTDTANFSDSSGSNTFTARPTVSTFSGTGFLNQASGFATVTATAASGTTDTANLYDASGSNTFTATPTSATFMGSGLSETANGFKSVFGYAATGTNDSANLSSTSGSNILYEAPTGASYTGTGFYNKALGFSSVTATAGSGTNDTAYLSDTSGSNTFTATPTSATFMGTGLSLTANGFKQVIATAASGTTDTANFSDSVGHPGTFVGKPTTSSMSGSGFANTANNFAIVSATTVTTGIANLFDDALGALFTGSSGKLGTLTGTNYRISTFQYGTVNLTGATGASNRIHLNAIDYVLNQFGTWTPE